jgi:hypothetical protein
MDDCLPPGDKHMPHPVRQFDGFGVTDLLLAGMNLLGDVNFLLCQELLRAAAGDSARAVVIPVDLGRGFAG